MLNLLKNGGPCRDRTYDLGIKSLKSLYESSTYTSHNGPHGALRAIIGALFGALLLSACGTYPEKEYAGPHPANQSDLAQMADVGTTYTALELMDGFKEGNPIVAPFVDGSLMPEPIGYAVLSGLKLGINYGLRQADNPRTCADGVRILTSTGIMAAVSNATLMILGPPGWAALLVGLSAGLVNAAYNDNFIDECRLRERFPDYDIDRAWENGTLYGEGVRK